ncbi:hypothetical protein EGW08_002109 [Elysia chlorotica]|uniref:Uncharacterized protein n=1 Tax=Elysia chlorotica TaxID=188477 RepID=A0A433U8L1_ELYCH|nr:hypothetical protein EGW08_002109 [Elysia chlorotica]
MPPMKPHAGVCGPQRRSLRAQRLIQPQNLEKPTTSKSVKDIFGCSENDQSSRKFVNGEKAYLNSPEEVKFDAFRIDSDDITGSDLKVVSEQGRDNSKFKSRVDLDLLETKYEHNSCGSESITAEALDTKWAESQSQRNKDGEHLSSRCENVLQLPARHSVGAEKGSPVPCSDSRSRPSCSAPCSPDSCSGHAYPSLLADLNNSDVAFEKLLLDELPLGMRGFPLSSTFSMTCVASSVCTSESDSTMALAANAMCESLGRSHQESAFLDAACMNFDPDKVNDGQFDVLEGYSFLW